MSLLITIKITCDTCGKGLETDVHSKSRVSPAVWAMVRGWETVSRGRYLPDAHYCPNCLDKPMRPIPKAKSGILTHKS